MFQSSTQKVPLKAQIVSKYPGRSIEELELVSAINGIAEQLSFSNTSNLEYDRMRQLVTELQALKKRLRALSN